MFIESKKKNINQTMYIMKTLLLILSMSPTGKFAIIALMASLVVGGFLAVLYIISRIYDGETVVLDDLVREAIVLELPISPLCSEDCAGMASDPAVADWLAQARVDPRLQKLAELRDKLPAGNKK